MVEFKPKKSVALSGVPAGNTALCSVGKSGNDLHYRGYDILDLAKHCEFEEVSYLLIHEKLPNLAELNAYKAKLKKLRGLPDSLKRVLEQIPASAHPMDVVRTGVSALGTMEPEADAHEITAARELADRLVACIPSILVYWYHFSHNGKKIEVETADDSVAAHFLHMLHGEAPNAQWEKSMQISLILYAEHEFNASTFAARVIAGTGSDMYSAITGAIGALLTSYIKFKTYDITMVLNGILAGLVGITAGADKMGALDSVYIGAIGGALVVLAVIAFDKIKIDDPVGAIAVHLIGGIWGTLAVGIFGELAGLNQLLSQLIGIAAVGAFCFGSSWLIFFTLKRTVGIRVDEKEEIEGLDINEHQMRAYPDFATKD